MGLLDKILGKKKQASKEVSFVKMEEVLKMGSKYTYEIYNGPDAETAKAFLQKTPVILPHWYIIVNTPKGSYCRDIQGTYEM